MSTTGKRRFTPSSSTNPVGELMEEIVADGVKRNVDIVSLFGSFGVPLEQKGHSFMGKCPWHEDSTPSLSVDREKGLYNCFGCGESGDAITLVRKMQGTGFSEAVTWLKQQNGRLSFSTATRVTPKQSEAARHSEPPKPKSSKPEQPTPEPTQQQTEGQFSPSQPSNVSLDDLVNHWAGVLETNQEAQTYLESRGLTDRRIWKRFGIGYSDGSLPEKLSASQIEAAKNQGILTKPGNEVFTGFIVVPLLNEQERCVSLYGRAITETTEPHHRYLAGPRRGLVNGKALSVYSDRLILTESVIDALSLIQAGIENVIPAYGTGGLSDQMLTHLTEQRVKEVVIAFDGDAAGRSASDKLFHRLCAAGIRIRKLVPEGGKDWNELLVAGTLNADSIKAQIEAAPGAEPTEPVEPVRITKEGTKRQITIAGRTYLALGVKELFATSLRINLRIETEAGRYLDNVDLYSARSRAGYAAGASALTGLDAKRLEKDLLLIIENLEADRDAAFTIEEATPKELTDEEREAGLALLRDPELCNRIIGDLSTCGYVGEDTNKLLLYLAATSRKLSDPLSVMVIAESASGKSRLIDTVARLMPGEDVVSMTSLSDQALNYLPEDGLLHKFLVMGEALHSEVIELQIREMLSAKELSRLVTIKDPKTGDLMSRLVRKKVLVSVALSSTNYTVNPENASRFFVVNADESTEQTKRIHEAQKQKYSLARITEGEQEVPGIVQAHQSAQRLLQSYRIVNPFAQVLDFPTQLMRARRDHERFLDLIASVAFLRQYQKEIKETIIDGQDQPVTYIECDLSDYRIAYKIMMGVLPATLSAFPQSAARMYDHLRDLLRRKARAKNLEFHEVTVSQREIREATGLGQMMVKRSLRALVDWEYVQVAGGLHRGMKHGYRMREDSALTRVDLSMIPDPEQMASKLQFIQSGSSGSNRVTSGSDPL